MNCFFLKRRLATGLWLAGLLEIILVLAVRYYGQQVDELGRGDGVYILTKLSLWLNGLIWAGLLVSYLFGYRVLGVTREYWVHGSSMTALDDAKPAPPANRDPWFSGLISLVAMFALVAGLGLALFMYHVRNPTLLGIVEHGSVAALSERLATDVSAINDKNKAGLTPLMLAIKMNREDMALELLVHGAKVDSMDRSGRSALYYAIGNPGLVELLLQKGADVDHADAGGMTPLHWAISHKGRDAVRLLLQYGADVNQRNGVADTPLLMAVKGRFNAVGLLLMHGADANLADQIGETPLHVAAANDDLDAARALIDAGAQVAPVSMQGWTPLHVASLKGSLSVVALLLQSKVDADLENARSQTAINCAILGNNPKVVDYLLEHGADVNRTDRQGNTYLHFSLEEQHYDIVKLLIQAGANIDIVSDAGVTARDLIHSQGHDKLLANSNATVLQ